MWISAHSKCIIRHLKLNQIDLFGVNIANNCECVTRRPPVEIKGTYRGEAATTMLARRDALRKVLGKRTRVHSKEEMNKFSLYSMKFSKVSIRYYIQ